MSGNFHEPWSRRKLFAYGAAGVLLSGRAVFGQSDPAAPALPTGDNGASLLTVPVQVNGRPFSFVVDTGADRTVMADSAAAALGLTGHLPVKVEGVLRTVDTMAVLVGRLDAGPITRLNLDIPILPRRQLQADGYLGLDVIDGYRLHFDFAGRMMRILEPRSGNAIGPEGPREVLVRLAGSDGHLRAFDCRIDGVRATTFIDTGAEISVGNGALFERLVAADASHGSNETIALTGVTGGHIEGRVTTIRRVRLGGLDVEDSRVAIADLQIFRLWQLDDRPALLIGMNWLRRFNRVSLDYGRHEARFDLALGPRREEPLDCAAPGGCRYSVG